MIEKEYNGKGCARLVAACVTQALCSAPAVNTKAAYRKYAQSCMDFRFSPMIQHFCDVFDYDIERLIKALERRAIKYDALADSMPF